MGEVAQPTEVPLQHTVGVAFGEYCVRALDSKATEIRRAGRDVDRRSDWRPKRFGVCRDRGVIERLIAVAVDLGQAPMHRRQHPIEEQPDRHQHPHAEPALLLGEMVYEYHVAQGDLGIDLLEGRHAEAPRVGSRLSDLMRFAELEPGHLPPRPERALPSPGQRHRRHRGCAHHRPAPTAIDRRYPCRGSVTGAPGRIGSPVGARGRCSPNPRASTAKPSPTAVTLRAAVTSTPPSISFSRALSVVQMPRTGLLIRPVLVPVAGADKRMRSRSKLRGRGTSMTVS